MAIAIFAVIATLALTGYTELQRQSEYSEQRLARLRDVQRAVQTICQDLVQLEPRPIREPLGDGFVPALQATDKLEYRVQLTRAGWSNTAGVARPTLQRVGYRLDQAEPVVARSLAGARPHAHRRAREAADAGRRAQHQLPFPDLESRLGRALAGAAGGLDATSAAARPRSRS